MLSGVAKRLLEATVGAVSVVDDPCLSGEVARCSTTLKLNPADASECLRSESPVRAVYCLVIVGSELIILAVVCAWRGWSGSRDVVKECEIVLAPC